MERRARLLAVKDSREVSWSSDPQFWQLCQSAILLALREEGVLDETQYQAAEGILTERSYRSRGR